MMLVCSKDDRLEAADQTCHAPAILQPPDQLWMAHERQDLQNAMTCLPVFVRSVSSPT